MKVVELSEAKQDIGSWAKNVKSQPVLITRKGKPWMLLSDASIYDWEDIGYMTDPKFWKMIDKSRRATSYVSMAEVRRKYGLPAKPRRARASAARRRTAVARRSTGRVSRS